MINGSNNFHILGKKSLYSFFREKYPDMKMNSGITNKFIQFHITAQAVESENSFLINTCKAMTRVTNQNLTASILSSRTLVVCDSPISVSWGGGGKSLFR